MRVIVSIFSTDTAPAGATSLPPPSPYEDLCSSKQSKFDVAHNLKEEIEGVIASVLFVYWTCMYQESRLPHSLASPEA